MCVSSVSVCSWVLYKIMFVWAVDDLPASLLKIQSLLRASKDSFLLSGWSRIQPGCCPDPSASFGQPIYFPVEFLGPMQVFYGRCRAFLSVVRSREAVEIMCTFRDCVVYLLGLLISYGCISG